MSNKTLIVIPMMLLVGCNFAGTASETKSDRTAGSLTGKAKTVQGSSDSTMGLNGPVQCIWPPNHKMVEVKLPSIDPDKFKECVVKKIESSEAVDAAGGNKDSHLVDFEIPQNQKDARAFLRAERSGDGKGRIYDIISECKDATGEAIEQKQQVIVPHDLGHDAGCGDKVVSSDKDVGKELDDLKKQKDDLIKKNEERKEDKDAGVMVPPEKSVVGGAAKVAPDKVNGNNLPQVDAGSALADADLGQELSDFEKQFADQLKDIEDRIAELEKLIQDNEQVIKLYGP